MTEPQRPREDRTIAVVIPTYRGAGHLPAAIDSLAVQDGVRPTVVVVDNASTDGTAELLAGQQAGGLDLAVLRQNRNLGFAGGVNVGIRWALARGFRLIALLNDDAVADPAWLATLLDTLQTHPESGIATGLMLTADGATIDSAGEGFSRWGMSFPGYRGESAKAAPPSGPVFGASGGASLFRAEVFETVGLFDEHFFAYYEDADLAFRARLAGFGVQYERTAVVRHQQGATSSGIPGFAVEQTFKNTPLLLVKDLPPGLRSTVACRFCLLYLLMLVSAIARGQAIPALRGAARGLWLSIYRGPSARRRVQRTRTVPAARLKVLLTEDPPPGMSRLTSLSKFAGRRRPR